jgi:hypothetical protein
MTLVDARRPPFTWLSNESLERIETQLPGNRQVGARTTLLGMAQAAGARRDGHHEEGDTLADIARHACLSPRRTLDYLRDLASIGLVAIEPQTDPRGRTLETIYRMIDSPDESSGRADANASELSGPPDGSDAELSGPTRARPEKEKKKEEREREGERAQEISAGQGFGGDQSEAMAVVVAVFESLLSQRGQRLSAVDRLALQNAVRSTPDGVDVVGVARRIERGYGPDGRAARQLIRSVPALFNDFVQRSTPEPPETELPARRTRRAAVSIADASSLQRLKLHRARPDVNPAPPEIAAAWEQVLQALQHSGAWAWADTVGLAGVLALLVDDAGGDRDQVEHVIVLEAADRQVNWLAANGRRLTRLFEQVLERDVTVEISPRPAGAKVTAA